MCLLAFHSDTKNWWDCPFKVPNETENRYVIDIEIVWLSPNGEFSLYNSSWRHMSAFLLQNNGPDFSKPHDGLVTVKAKLPKNCYVIIRCSSHKFQSLLQYNSLK